MSAADLLFRIYIEFELGRRLTAPIVPSTSAAMALPIQSSHVSEMNIGIKLLITADMAFITIAKRLACNAGPSSLA